MDPLPDQFLFVNKSARSGSLSHSNPEERFFIHSHVHGKFHKNKRQTRQRSLLPESPSKSDCPNSQSTFETSRTTNGSQKSSGSTAAKPLSRQKHLREAIPDIQENSYSKLGSSTPLNMVDANAIDPFYCTSTALDAKDQRLLYYPFTSFIETTFNAESLSGTTSSTTFRHREAIIKRLRRCVVDKLTMYSTLAYCASCMRWAIREEERERPPEFYVLKAIEALKIRLERAQVVDTWLVLSIYALAVSEMWAQNYEAATAHLKMTRHLVTQLGGLTKLDPYLMESILLCDKYVAIGKLEAPIFPLDWDPGSLPAQKMLKIQVEVEPLLSELTQGFFDLDKHILGTEMLQVIDNIRVCAQVSQQMGTQEMTDPSDQHWLFLRHQAIFCRLLSLPTSSKTQECCRVALIVWLLKITVYFGAQRWSKRLLPDLKAAILRVDKAGEWCPSALVFWMTSLGAMTAEYTDERDWFLKRTTKAASTNGDHASVLDINAHPTAQKLNARCVEFFAEVQDLTPGKDLEQRLNTHYGPDNPYYQDFCEYILQGLKEGWVAETKLDGNRYRRGKIALPSSENRFFSIAAVYMDSQDVYSGQHHAHPYGEINCVVQIDKAAELKGMQGWQGAGWTSPGPGTHHYPQVRGGALVALFFLPAGRISYSVDPSAPQPHCV